MIKELTGYISTNTVFTEGEDLFAEAVDSDLIDECIVVEEAAPGLADGNIDGKRQIPLVVYARAKTRFTARGNIYVVFDFIHKKMQISLPAIDAGPTYVCNFVCGTPYYKGLDETFKQYVFVMPINAEMTNIL